MIFFAKNLSDEKEKKKIATLLESRLTYSSRDLVVLVEASPIHCLCLPSDVVNNGSVPENRTGKI